LLGRTVKLYIADGLIDDKVNHNWQMYHPRNAKKFKAEMAVSHLVLLSGMHFECCIHPSFYGLNDRAKLSNLRRNWKTVSTGIMRVFYFLLLIDNAFFIKANLLTGKNSYIVIITTISKDCLIFLWLIIITLL
jgi:hypothetical protein